MKKIILIIPYFGKLPDYFGLWKMSAIMNPSVDFLIVTDIPGITEADNIKVRQCTFEEFRNRVQARFSFPIKLFEPYKCCDLKPAYAYIFEEEIKDYDFWGHCDIDLIFGNIRNFLTEDILEKYDKIFEHGHFCLYRNTPDLVRLFENDGDYPEINYKECFQTEDNYAFDEFPGMLIKSRRLGIRTYADTNAFWDAKTDSKSFKDAFAPDSQNKAIMEYSNGKLYVHQIRDKDYGNGEYNKIRSREIMYFHFQKRVLYGIKEEYLQSGKFFIVPNRLVDSCEDKSTLFEVKGEKIYHIKYKYRNKIKKLRAHIKRYFKQKRAGEVKNLGQYLTERRALQKRFAETRAVVRSFYR